MAPSTTTDDADKNIKFLILILKTCDTLKPDYHEVARQAGICDANTAQKKFKKLVEQGGYDLVKGRVVRRDGKPATSVPVPATPKKTAGSKGKKARGDEGVPPQKKKRKVEAVSGSDGYANEDEGEITDHKV